MQRNLSEIYLNDVCSVDGIASLTTKHGSLLVDPLSPAASQKSSMRVSSVHGVTDNGRNMLLGVTDNRENMLLRVTNSKENMLIRMTHRRENIVLSGTDHRENMLLIDRSQRRHATD